VTTKEKRLLRLALVIFIGYILPFQLVPVALKYYRDYQANIDNLLQQIEREIELGKRADYWEAENQQVKQEQEQIEAGLLAGRTRELVGARMQGLIKQLAQEAGITFRTLEPPDTSFNSREWVLVIQSMQFEANSGTLMAFLQAVANAKENLKVVSLEVRSYRNRLNGTIKVTGFSRISTAAEPESTEEVPPPAEPTKPEKPSAAASQPNEAATSPPVSPNDSSTLSPQPASKPESANYSQPEDLQMSPEEEALLLEEEELSLVTEEAALEEMNNE
jgi:hypothetical protein